MSDPEQADLRQRLYDHIESFEELHVLAWLKQRPNESIDEDAIAEGTLIHPNVLSEVLARLTSVGLLSATTARPTRFRYDPKDPELREVIDPILARYESTPLEIIRIMTANAIERVRTAALSTFANAFRLRGPKRND